MQKYKSGDYVTLWVKGKQHTGLIEYVKTNGLCIITVKNGTFKPFRYRRWHYQIRKAL